MPAKSSVSLLEVARKAIRFLENHQAANGAICDPTFHIFDVWETVNGTAAISLWAERLHYDLHSLSDNALRFLASSENSNGMVYHSHVKETDNTFCVETTSEYVLLLLQLLDLHPNRRPDISQKLEFLRQLQSPSGYWNIVSPEVPERLQCFPCVTAFALKALTHGNTEPRYGEVALDFLRGAQNEEGHWGLEWEYYGTPFYPMAPILDVLAHRSDRERHELVLQNAERYLLESQREDGSWFCAFRDFPQLPSPELQTALALRCCVDCRLEPDDEPVSRGTRWLLSRQNADGSWSGGHFPAPLGQKCENIYATSQALIALDRIWCRGSADRLPPP